MGEEVRGLVERVASLDDVEELHMARLLLLIEAFSGKDGKDSVEGLTKLAKLDFLLRYPVLLERALEAKNKSVRDVMPEEHERTSVESEMVRYRFGPWDHRYRSLLNLLAAKGLVAVSVEGRTVVVTITERGRSYAKRLSKNDIFEPYVRRAGVLKRHFDLKGTNLMRFIYETFPEVVSLRSGESISQ